MEYKRFQNTVIVRIDPGEEILELLLDVVTKEKIRLADVSALGAVNEFVVGVFDTKQKKYHSNSFKGDFEIVSLTGTVTEMDGKSYFHLHMSAGDRSGKVFGGHLNRAMVSATCEMVIHIIDGSVGRTFSESVGLNLFDFH